MQARLRALIENRTRMLAAISHDLRTPLTLLRLRVENVENPPEREKMLATIAEMDGTSRRALGNGIGGGEDLVGLLVRSR
jgi:signal transduction histidine kinase